MQPSGRAVLLLFFALSLLTGCALMPSGPPSGIPPSAAPKVRIDNIPFFPQTAYQCGPAALAMALQWSGVPVTPEELVPQVYTPQRKGTLQPGLVTGARRHKRLAYPVHGLECLIREVDAGHPVIVLQNLGLSWLPKWHYALVIGYDLNLNSVLLHTGQHAFRRVGMSTFMRTWRRGQVWGLLVLPAGEPPVCAREHPYLKAVLGLEQAGHRDAAATAYQAASRKWPLNPQWPMALGNVLYAQGLLPESVRAFSAALEVDAENGAALNNIAHVLAQLGELEKAEAMARRAVALGGARTHLYRQTLNDILLQKSGTDP